MDGCRNMSEIGASFRTPVRILFPKILKSRDGWKAKSHRRKAQLKAAKIKIRDVSASRDLWRRRSGELHEQNRRLQQHLAQAEREREEARAALARLAEAQKK